MLVPSDQTWHSAPNSTKLHQVGRKQLALLLVRLLIDFLVTDSLLEYITLPGVMPAWLPYTSR